MKTSSQWLASLAVLTVLTVGSGCGSSSPEPESDLTSAPPPPPPADPFPVREEPVVVSVPAPALEPIHFEYNKYRITPEARLQLEEVSLVMKENPDWSLVLEGHCDERGTTEYNVALGESRAQAAKRYLVSLGIDEKRFTTVSFGEERPVDRRAVDEAWAKNRRAEFRLRTTGS